MKRRAHCLWALLSLALPARADEPGFGVELHCRPEAAPGRVLCELTYSVEGGRRLTWTDALVTAAPDFARPLRARVPQERFGQPPAAHERRLSLAFVAARVGTGPVTVRARAVVCQGEGQREVCRPYARDVQAELRVGS